VRELVRKNFRFFFVAAIAGIALRLLFILRFPAVTSDSLVYGDIAKNWLQHGIYGLSGTVEISPTYIRLPGYPAFLAWVFAIFGMEHYRAVLVLQMLVDLGTCLVIADMARRPHSARAAKIAFLLAALCPFLASYAAAALTETLEIFFTAIALDLAMIGIESLGERRLRTWWWCGLAVGAAMLLRPDAGLLLLSIAGYLGFQLVRPCRAVAGRRSQLLRATAILVFTALAPLVPWTVRNLHTFHRFQPLAPRYANEEDQYVPMGFNRWVKTWIVDYASVEEIYWPVPGDKIEPSKLPSRAFDSPPQRQQTLETLSEYNDTLHIDPELDAKFEALAAQRIHAAPLRYYVWLPWLRIVDMWLRPRTETLPSDSRWWEFNDDPKWLALSLSLGVIGLFYLGAALAGLMRGDISFPDLLLGFVIVRSLFLGTLENPEPRYTLECYPVVILLAERFLSRKEVSPPNLLKPVP
jgi:4-amino-4-deoxy-L-arabinose transferase-like glycosyltransferase